MCLSCPTVRLPHLTCAKGVGQLTWGLSHLSDRLQAAGTPLVFQPVGKADPS